MIRMSQGRSKGHMRDCRDTIRQHHFNRHAPWRCNILPSTRAEVPESDSLFWREVHHNKTIDTGRFRILHHPLFTIGQQRVVVTHEQHRRLETFSSCTLDHVQGGCDRDAILQSLCVGLLYGRAVRNGICEGKTKFDEI